jgi:hypothetical protein
VLADDGSLLVTSEPSRRRIVGLALLGLTLPLLVALVFAASARADDPNGELTQGPPATTSAEASPEATAPAGDEESAQSAAPQAGEPQTAPPAEEPASSPQPEGPPVEQPLEVVHVPPVVEVPTIEAAEVKVEVPAVEVPVVTVPVEAPKAPAVEASIEVPSAKKIVEETAEAVSAPPVAQENPKAQNETVTPRDSEDSAATPYSSSQAVAAALAAASPPAESIASASTGESQATTPSGLVPALPAPTGQAAAAHRAEAFACALSSLGESLGDICSASSRAGRLLSDPSFGLVTVADRSAGGGANAPAGESHSPLAVATPPVNPAPSPAPCGSSGAAAAGSGVAPVGFFNLSGLLRMGAPRAMRRLRLSFRPRTTACFALIPERPG